MKVLKNASTWEPRRVTCQGAGRACGAELEIEFSDLKRTHHERHGQREPSWDQVFVTCPECGAVIDVRDVPPHLVERISDTGAIRHWHD